MAEREKVIEKVQKLLNHSEGAKKIGSLEEANTAALKAQQIIEQYNLEQHELNPKQKLIIGELLLKGDDIKFNPKEGFWLRDLLNTLAYFNFCHLIYFTTNSNLRLVGTQDNCNAVAFLFDQIRVKFKQLEKQQWANYQGSEKRGSFRRGYFKGANEGLSLKLYLERAATLKQENSLLPVLVKNHKQEIQDYLDQKHPNLIHGDRKERKLVSQDGQLIGYHDGKNISINEGLNKGENLKTLG